MIIRLKGEHKPSSCTFCRFYEEMEPGDYVDGFHGTFWHKCWAIDREIEDIRARIPKWCPIEDEE